MTTTVAETLAEAAKALAKARLDASLALAQARIDDTETLTVTVVGARTVAEALDAAAEALDAANEPLADAVERLDAAACVMSDELEPAYEGLADAVRWSSDQPTPREGSWPAT